MKPIFFYDTETTGLPDWSTPSEAEHQPHMVQLAALLVDPQTHGLSEFMHVIIKPQGWTWDEENEAFKTHGITFKRALAEGIPEKEAFDRLIDIWNMSDFRVGYNESFDARIVRIASFRYAFPELIDTWKAGQAQCAMKMARPICKIPAPANARRWGPYKNPTLAEAYKHFTGIDLVDAHSAMADAKACMEVYFRALEAAPMQAA